MKSTTAHTVADQIADTGRRRETMRSRLGDVETQLRFERLVFAKNHDAALKLEAEAVAGFASAQDAKGAKEDEDQQAYKVEVLERATAALRAELRSLEDAAEKLAGQQMAEARRVALMQVKAVAHKMAPLLHEAAALNAELDRLFDVLGGPASGVPFPWIELRPGHDSPLSRWLRDLEAMEVKS